MQTVRCWLGLAGSNLVTRDTICQRRLQTRSRHHSDHNTATATTSTHSSTILHWQWSPLIMSDGDLDLSLSPVKRSGPRQGRRAAENSWGGAEADTQESWTELSSKPPQGEELFASSTGRAR